jgi:hypothetical protein
MGFHEKGEANGHASLVEQLQTTAFRACCRIAQSDSNPKGKVRGTFMTVSQTVKKVPLTPLR